MIADMSRRAIIVHDLAQARAALAAANELGIAAELWSAPAAAASAGAGWFDAVIRLAQRDHPAVEVMAVLDCADRADLAQAALRQGLSHVCFRGRKSVADRLADIASQYQATLLRRSPRALDLLYVEDAPDACRRWLGGD